MVVNLIFLRLPPTLSNCAKASVFVGGLSVIVSPLPDTKTNSFFFFLFFREVALYVAFSKVSGGRISLLKLSPRTDLASAGVNVVVSGNPLAIRFALSFCDAVIFLVETP